jgi:hypothetical protein
MLPGLRINAAGSGAVRVRQLRPAVATPRENFLMSVSGEIAASARQVISDP